MITKGSSSFTVYLLAAAAIVVALLVLAAPSHAQSVQVDLSSTSNLCGGNQCFNVAGIFSTGTKFLGTTGMDNGNNCTPTPPYTNCPDAYSSNQLGLSSATPPTLTPPSLNVLFNFGTVNTTNCGPSTSTACTVDVVQYNSSGVVITLPPPGAANNFNVFSTMLILGTSLNGAHQAKITATYAGSQGSDVFLQTQSDWCGFSSGTATDNGSPIGVTESIAVGGMNRINSDGTLNGASCNLYAYTLPLNVANTLASITLEDPNNSNTLFALAISLKPPSYTINGSAASPTSVGAGSSATATVTVVPQTGYTTTSPTKTVNLSCTIAPTIVTNSAEAAPTCSLNPTSVTVTAGEASPPTTTLTFTAASSSSKSSMSMRQSNIFYAFLLVPGVALTGFGFGSNNSRRKRLFGLMLFGLVLIGIAAMPGCVSYTHLGNVGTPPGQYTVSITGVDDGGLTQASNSAGTTNTVVVSVTQ
jgi:hypothetical protein